MNDYGKLLILFLAIGLILLAASGKGRQVIADLTGKKSAPGSTQKIPESNPTNLPQDANGGTLT